MSGFLQKIRTFLFRLFCPAAARREAARKTVPTRLDEFFGCDELAITKIVTAGDANYSIFHLWKDSEQTKKRQIEAPKPELKHLQRIILRKFLYSFASSPYAHGFVCGRSIGTNAAQHTGKAFVLKLDLKNFFPSVSRKMIWQWWQECGLVTSTTKPALETILKLCLYEDRLPQGAPTSPALANLVCRKLDFTLAQLARKQGMTYSRYADDLTFSGDSNRCYKLIPVIKKIVSAYGFTMNDKKVHVLKQHQRQTVTGLVVNHPARTGVKRRSRMKLRAYMHQIITGEIPVERVNLQKLRGHVSFIRQADAPQGLFFAEQLEKIEKMF